MTTRSTTTEAALEPCPFCGGNAILTDKLDEGGRWSVYCRACKSGTGWTTGKEKAVERWNCRIPAPSVAPVVDHDTFVRSVAALPCARVDGDQCCFFERGIANYCASCQAREMLERPAPAFPAALRDEATPSSLPNAPDIDPNRTCWASTANEACINPRECDDRGCQRYADEDYRSKHNQLTSKDIRAELIAAHGAMPRRHCAVHNREEFKYESLEHELRAATTPSSTWIQAAAEEIADLSYSRHREEKIAKYVEIIERCFSGGTKSVEPRNEACLHCNHVDCECSDFDASPDMGAK